VMLRLLPGFMNTNNDDNDDDNDDDTVTVAALPFPSS